MNNNKIEKEKPLKFHFPKLVWYSITKFEKYPEMAALGLKKALLYFTEIMLIFSIIVTLAFIYTIEKSSENDNSNKSDNYRTNNEQLSNFSRRETRTN